MRFSKLIAILDKVKWFGLRKLYWMIKVRIIELKETLIDLKIIYPKYSQTLVKRRIGRKIIKNYSGDDGHNINCNQFFLGFGLIHYTIIRNIKPKNILCIGSRKGFIPTILALACKDNGTGHVDFVDAGYGKENPDKNWSGNGFWKKENAKKHFNKISVDKFISTYVMTSKKYASRYPRKKYQYIYIDGDHSYKGVKLDYNLFWPKLEKFGFMSFHDIKVKGYLDKGLFGVWKLWKEIANQHSIIFPFPNDSGLGIIQKL